MWTGAVRSYGTTAIALVGSAEDVAAGRLEAKPSRVFRFEEVREAHRVMEANEAGGKMVVVHD